MQDWQLYYERGRADLDGIDGFVLAFMSAFSSFAARTKLRDLRRVRGELPNEEPVPRSIREMLEFMAQVLQQGAESWLRLPAPGREDTPDDRVRLLWHASTDDTSGFGEVSRDFLLALREAGEPVAIAADPSDGADAGLTSESQALIEAQTVPADASAEICVIDTLVPPEQPAPNGRFNIARTMFETDWLPSGADIALNTFDRIWVPSAFNRETFIQSGVDPEKLAVIPDAIDPAPFADENVEPWPLPGEEAYRFLSLFDWTLRKGWDLLLEAFAAEFGDDPHVGLVLKVWSSLGYTLEDIRGRAEAHLQNKLGKGLGDLPNIHFWQETVPAHDLPRIYRSVEAFVLPTRGEGWCRPLMEAMAAGLPTIVTAWSGPTEYHNDRVGYPLKYKRVPVSPAGARELPRYAGHCWAEPDLPDLRRLMRQLVADPQSARGRGLAAKGTIAHQYSPRAVGRLLREELAHCRQPATLRAPSSPSSERSPHTIVEPHPAPIPSRPAANPVFADPVPAVSFQSQLGRSLRVRWEGDLSLRTSASRANRELCLGLIAPGDVELALGGAEAPTQPLTARDDPRWEPLLGRFGATLSGTPDVIVRQSFPPDWRRPDAGKLVVIQPWEYSHLPQEWVAGAGAADEVWVHSRYVRDSYVRSGVPAEKVRIVPLGVDPEIFRPDGPRFALPTAKSLRFLFVGSTLSGKGADLLLAAYSQAFTPEDDVCLVVKNVGKHLSDEGQRLAEAFQRAQSDPALPEILYIDRDLTDHELASLYRACSCVVLPYRAEEFALPPLEGMACGLPVIVTSGGPPDDYLDDAMALRVPHRRLAASRDQVGSFACVGEPWHLEADLGALIGALRWVREHPDRARERGERAHAHSIANWTWKHAVDLVRQRLCEEIAPPPARPAVSARLWGEPSPPTPATDGSAAIEEPIELSLCLIARDEESRIASCLNSIAPFVDEMIVVDTGSKDRTREIALQCGARVFDSLLFGQSVAIKFPIGIQPIVSPTDRGVHQRRVVRVSLGYTPDHRLPATLSPNKSVSIFPGSIVLPPHETRA